jgi:hypothetical protein
MTFLSFASKNTKRSVPLAVPDCEHPLDGRNTPFSVQEVKTANESGAQICNSCCRADLINDTFICHLDKTESEPGYKINHCFDIGNRDRYKDHKKNERREYHRKCLSSEAFESYMLGYQEGFGGKHRSRRDHRLSSWARTNCALKLPRIPVPKEYLANRQYHACVHCLLCLGSPGLRDNKCLDVLELKTAQHRNQGEEQ